MKTDCGSETDLKTVEFGWPIGMPTCRPVGSGLVELRSHICADRIARVLFCIEDDAMILSHGFIEKSRKTPTKDLDFGRSRMRKALGSTR